jgi:hypothetical protein
VKSLSVAALLLLGCGAAPDVSTPPAATAPTDAPADCVAYHWTRALPGSGTDAAVAADGSIVAVSELQGLHAATVLDRDGNALGSFALDPFTSQVRIAAGGHVVAAAADGRVRSFGVDGSVVWTAELGHAVVDLVALVDGGAVVSGQAATGVVSFLDAQGNVQSRSSMRAAAFIVADDSGRLALTSRDACSIDHPCGTGFDPNQVSVPSAAAPATDAGGVQTSAVVLLDATHHTTGGFISGVNAAEPLGPIFIRSGLLGPDALVVQASAVSIQRQRASIDVDPGLGVVMRDVDTDAAPDHLLGLTGRSLAWDHGFEPLDDSGRARLVGLFANRRGVAVDVNGDVYKTHHILQLGPDGAPRLRYDKPNDGIANDVRLAGMDERGRIVLSGRFEGTQDFDPSAGSDVLTATPEARRYVTVLSACEP